MILSIRTRLGLAAGAAIAVSGTMLSFALLYSFRTSLIRSSLAELETEAVRVAGSADEGLIIGGDSGTMQIRYAALLDSSGRPLASQGRAIDRALTIATVREALDGRASSLPDPARGHYLVAAAPVLASAWEGDPPNSSDTDALYRQARAVLLVASLHEINEACETLITLLALLVPVASALAGLGGIWMGGRALAPVNEMSRWAATTGGHDLKERISVPPTGDEIAGLAETLNLMMERIEEAFSRNARFVADASHEIRNPLTNLSSEIQASLRRERTAVEYQATLASVLDEVRRLSRLADGLLFLSRADAGRAIATLERLDLAALARDTASGFEAAARQKKITIQVDGDETVVSGDAAALRRLIENLIDNAIRYTPDGGKIFVRVEKENDHAVLTVTDTGPGISEEDRAHANERFWRGAYGRSASPTGAGLGLAICSEVADAHGGNIEIGRAEGAGCRIILNLPGLHDSFMSAG